MLKRKKKKGDTFWSVRCSNNFCHHFISLRLCFKSLRDCSSVKYLTVRWEVCKHCISWTVPTPEGRASTLKSAFLFVSSVGRNWFLFASDKNLSGISPYIDISTTVWKQTRDALYHISPPHPFFVRKWTLRLRSALNQLIRRIPPRQVCSSWYSGMCGESTHPEENNKCSASFLWGTLGRKVHHDAWADIRTRDALELMGMRASSACFAGGESFMHLMAS